MNIETTNADTTPTPEPSLDDFEATFFQTKTTSEEPAPVETQETVEDDGVATNDTNNDSVVEDIEELEDSDENDDGTPPKKETRAEKRIRELNAKYREEERKRLELEERIAKLELPKNDNNTPNNDNKTPTETVDSGPKAPHWDDEDEKGNKKYPLGQFDPQFNADLVRFTVQEEQRRLEERQRQTEESRRIQEAEAAMQAEWEEKLAPALERYPDYVDKGQALIDQFAGLEPAYGKYLTDTIRAIDNGPDVFYHLATNPDLAKAIVARGPAAATVELGRLSAILDTDKGDSKTTPTPTKVTKAPTPPPTVRGSATPKLKNPDDDLDDFESVFFKRK